MIEIGLNIKNILFRNILFSFIVQLRKKKGEFLHHILRLAGQSGRFFPFCSKVGYGLIYTKFSGLILGFIV